MRLLPASTVRPTSSRTSLPIPRSVALIGAAVASAALAVAAHPAAAGAAPRAGDVARFTGKITSIAVSGRGNGHGHGMSQYGAQGAAKTGLNSRQILAFYYPGTTFVTLPASTIRVSISGGGTSTTVFGATTGISLSGIGTLPTGYEYFRLSVDGAGLALNAMSTDGTWHRLRSGLPAREDFTSSRGYVRLLLTDGTSTRYWGSIGAVRNGAGLLTINRVSLDSYTQGVVPREMPASWLGAATASQAIAARTYAADERQANASGLYDICDSSYCQVYGGWQHYATDQTTVLWQDDPDALRNNNNVIMEYQGRPIFAQFSASNGGAELDGGQPYLVSQADPYDNAASGDPYLSWSKTVQASTVAAYYGLKTVTSITVTKRSGSGAWGGWVLTANVTGTDSTGTAKTVATTGPTLAYAMGVLTSFFQFTTS